MAPAEPKLIVNLTRGNVVCERGVIADRALERMRGLLGRRAMVSGEGLLLTPAPSIHTAFMRFPIDAVFLDANMRIVRLVERLSPWRTASARRAKFVLELPAGETDNRGLAYGDKLAVLEPTVRPPAQTTRVLLITVDRRFRAAATTLLGQRGCAVTSVGDHHEDIRDLAAREHAEVVVIDASGSLTAAAQLAAKLQALRPRVGVVAISSDPREQLATLPVLSKWGSFDTLVAAIERASERSADARL